MPWPEPQRRAIFLRIKRKEGEAAARRFMRQHGYGKSRNALIEAHRKSKGRGR